jgi:4-amino-4-deoxy-L-arabinose transferase-like glycosyltransferase
VVGVLATRERRYLKNGWLWVGVLLSLLIFLPNFLWEWKRDFISADFLRFIHERDVGEGLTDGFFAGQLELMMLAFPLALAGLWFCFVEEKRYRLLGWMYVVPLVLLTVMRGRDYYLAPGYPMLYAAGAVWVERKIRRATNAEVQRPRWAGIVKRVVVVALALDVVAAAAVALPIAPVNSAWWKIASKTVVVFPEEIGWEEFTQSVAEVWNRLPQEEKRGAAILAGNYGEVGALNLYGERFGLPRAISGVNSSWERGYGEVRPETVVVVGYPREFLETHFASCVVGGHVWNKYGVANEETVEDPEIFVCRGLKGSWAQFWKAARRFA